jgi:hypothetical protein
MAAAAFTVVFGWVNSKVWFRKTSNSVKVNAPGTSVGAEVVPVYIWGPAPRVDNPARQFVGVPLRHISHPPLGLLPNRINVGTIATGELFKE